MSLGAFSSHGLTLPLSVAPAAGEAKETPPVGVGVGLGVGVGTGAGVGVTATGHADAIRASVSVCFAFTADRSSSFVISILHVVYEQPRRPGVFQARPDVAHATVDRHDSSSLQLSHHFVKLRYRKNTAHRHLLQAANDHAKEPVQPGLFCE